MYYRLFVISQCWFCNNIVGFVYHTKYLKKDCIGGSIQNKICLNEKHQIVELILKLSFIFSKMQIINKKMMLVNLNFLRYCMNYTCEFIFFKKMYEKKEF